MMARATASVVSKSNARRLEHKPKTALYLRISLDDDNQDISNSIANQRDLLSAYVAVDPVLSASEVLTFADDGYSGTNFERPQVKALLDLVRRGGVQNIVVKDLSRWGRNYPEVSEYLDQIFPFLGVRFVSVNDQYDSADHKGQTAPMGVAFSSIVHDIYSKELSVKVAQAHLAKAKKGEFVHGSNFYGYVRSKEIKNRLVIDEAAAVVVQRIFDLASDGLSAVKIAAILNAGGVDSPLAHRIKSGQSTHGIKPAGGKAFWNNGQVLRILRDERYTGTMVSYKNKVPYPGSNKRIALPEHEWLKVPNAHEAIISSEQFTKVQGYFRNNKKTVKGISPNRSQFSGKIFCGHCSKAMRQRHAENSYHQCQSVSLGTGQGCYDGKMFISDLNNIVLAAVKLEAKKAMDLSSRQQRQQQTLANGSSEGTAIFSELKKLNGNIALLEGRNIALYESFAESKVDRAAYVAEKTENSAKLEVLQSRVAELNQRLAEIERTTTPHPTDMGKPLLHRILASTEATAEILSLVDRITVFEGGRIEIKFAFANMSPQGTKNML